MKTAYTLFALFVLALLLPQSTQAQLGEVILLDEMNERAYITMQDGTASMEVEGIFTVILADTLPTMSSAQPIQVDQDVHIELVSLSLTMVNVPQYQLHEGRPMAQCETGRLKEASTAMDAGRISVQRCSDEDDPLTVSPLRFDLSSDTPASETREHILLATFRALDGQCYIDDAATFSLCFDASR